MAHELSFQNGQAEAIYSGERKAVWHQLGNYVGDRAVTVEEARKVVGIPVEKMPVRYLRPIGNGDTVETVSEKAFLTVRTDTGEELASVGPSYTVVQHSDALLNAVMPILDSGFATIDVAGLLRQGLGGWVLLKWNLDLFDPIVREVYRDEIQAYGLCLSWHGEGNANSYANVTERAVCKNTIDIGMSAATLKTKVYHRRNANDAQLQAAQETFRHVIAHHKNMAEAYTALRSTQLTRQQWKALVADVAVPDPRLSPDWNKDAPRAELVINRYKEKVSRIFGMWANGSGHTGDGSAWEAYNGLIESLDHDTDLWKGRNVENRVLSLTDGPLAKVRQNVFQSLMAHVTANKILGRTA